MQYGIPIVFTIMLDLFQDSEVSETYAHMSGFCGKDGNDAGPHPKGMGAHLIGCRIVN